MQRNYAVHGVIEKEMTFFGFSYFQMLSFVVIVVVVFITSPY